MSEIARHRRGGQAGRRAERAAAPIIQKKYITREIPLYELLNAEGLEIVHEESMTILEEIGIDFRYQPAIKLWRAAGADVRGDRVHFPRGLVLEKIKTAPAQYTQHARNPERNVVIGGRNTVFAPTYGSPFVRDFENKRRYGTLEDLQNFIKLAYMTPVLHHSGGVICEPVDVPGPNAILDHLFAHPLFRQALHGHGHGAQPRRGHRAAGRDLFGDYRRSQRRADLGTQRNRRWSGTPPCWAPVYAGTTRPCW
jgi:trimethylamine--corrinoid protein Co-methyltransferase